jgi:uncharacterized membrane protein YgaE (UPF0421/DUF939 family)
MRDKLVPRRRLIVQVALASALAWAGAVWLFGDPRPFFAPIAAVIALNATGRRQLRQTIELVVGVAVGIGIADLLARLIGTGAIQIGVVVAVALITATLIDGGPLLFGQAASSGILVVALAQPGSSLAPTRLADALLGGGCALLMSIVILPLDADGQVQRAAGAILEGIAGVLDEIAGGLREGDVERARLTLVRARALDHQLARFREATVASSEIASLAPLRRYARDAVGRYVRAEEHVAALTGDTRVLARLIVQLMRIEAPLATQVPAAILDLAEAVRVLIQELGDEDQGVRRQSVVAATRAVKLARSEDPGSSSDLVAREVRSFALDILRARGIEERVARSTLDG